MNNEFKANSEKRHQSILGNAEVRRHLQSLPVFSVLPDSGKFEHLLEELSVAETAAPKKR
jgi:hypothetical protein